MWTGFLQGPKGLAMGGLRASGPEEFSRPLSRRGRQGDAASDALTGSKSQTTEGQLCPALDSQAAGSAGPQHAANCMGASQPIQIVPQEDKGRGAWTE